MGVNGKTGWWGGGLSEIEQIREKMKREGICVGGILLTLLPLLERERIEKES